MVGRAVLRRQDYPSQAGAPGQRGAPSETLSAKEMSAEVFPGPQEALELFRKHFP